MKKVLTFIILTIVLLSCFVACNEQTEHVHLFSEWTVVTDPTCTEAGLEERVCECEVKETRPVTALAHTYDDEYDAICNECGYERTIDCKHDKPEKIEIVPSQSPTCQETGLTEGMKCTLCGTMVLPQVTVGTIGCIAGDWIVYKDATKTENGSKYAQCIMCGTKVSEEVIYATGSLGLSYQKNVMGKTCIITGIGTCTDKEVIIPTHFEGYKVTAIRNEAFKDCTSLTSVVIPDSVTTIGDQAFYRCSSLASIVIPDSVTSIGDEAFDGCVSLASVVIGDSVTTIGSGAFYGCSALSSIVIGDGVTFIDSMTFRDCTSLTSVVMPDSITSIGDGAFHGCDSLTSVVIPDSVTTIGSSAFYSCNSLSSVVIGDSVASIGGYAFGGCSSLTSVVIPDSVTNIGYALFFNCNNLISIVIPDSVTTIGDQAFYRCSSLASIVIPDSVTTIGSDAFYWCDILKDVYYAGTEEEWEAITIGSSNYPLKNATIHYNYVPEN